jgi:hypothetical protein
VYAMTQDICSQLFFPEDKVSKEDSPCMQLLTVF